MVFEIKKYNYTYLDENADQYSIYFFGWLFFTLSLGNKIGWFRLFGRGISWKNIKKHDLLFSEKHGYVRRIVIGHWQFRLVR